MTHARTGTRTEIIRSGAMLGVFVGLLAMPQAIVARADGSMIQFVDNHSTFGDPQSVLYLNGEAITGGDSMVGTARYDATQLAAGPTGVGPSLLSGSRGSDVFGGSIYTIGPAGVIQQDGNPGLNFNTGKVNPTGLALFGNDIGLYGAVISGSGSNTVLTIIPPSGPSTDYNLGVGQQGLGKLELNGIAYLFTADPNQILRQIKIGPTNNGGFDNPALEVVGQWPMSGIGFANDLYVKSLGGRNVEFYAVNFLGVARSAPFQIVPAPGAAALMALALLTTSTRRRPEGTGNTRPRR